MTIKLSNQNIVSLRLHLHHQPFFSLLTFDTDQIFLHTCKQLGFDFFHIWKIFKWGSNYRTYLISGQLSHIWTFTSDSPVSSCHKRGQKIILWHLNDTYVSQRPWEENGWNKLALVCRAESVKFKTVRQNTKRLQITKVRVKKQNYFLCTTNVIVTVFNISSF